MTGNCVANRLDFCRKARIGVVMDRRLDDRRQQ
jgi:hypothetical protein